MRPDQARGALFKKLNIDGPLSCVFWGADPEESGGACENATGHDLPEFEACGESRHKRYDRSRERRRLKEGGGCGWCRQISWCGGWMRRKWRSNGECWKTRWVLAGAIGL